ncbi:ATP synthase mitochondrial F1 complex assembly factor 1 [Podila epigama]|nr:ATP synthase mitochondrial F1 complex assembly factor 1 [Podila epigama]
MASTFRALFGASSTVLRHALPQRSLGCVKVAVRSKHIDYTSKYADKLKDKARKEGVASVQELKAKILPQTQTAFKKVQPLDKAPTDEAKDRAQVAKAPSNAQKPAHSGSEHSLDKIMKLDLVADLDAENISKIWIQKHLDQQDSISAVVPAETYKKMLARSKEYPLFLLPLSHGDGVEFYLMQFAFHQVIFTSLLEYKTHGENARPYLTLTHYPELIDSKGIVLMNGTISTNPKVLTLEQAQLLVFGMQQYYVTDNAEKQALLHDFHKNPSKFSHERLIELTEISG